MSVLVTKQICSCWHLINLQPDFISSLQIKRWLEGKRFVLSNGANFIRPSTSNEIAVQIHPYINIRICWRSRKMHQSSEWKWISSIPWRREFPRVQVHSPTDVQFFLVKRNRRICYVETIKTHHNVKVNGWRFDVHLPNPRLETCEKNNVDIYLIEFC